MVTLNVSRANESPIPIGVRALVVSLVLSQATYYCPIGLAQKASPTS